MRDDRPFGGADPPAAVVEANIPRRISPAGAAFCRPMPLVVDLYATGRQPAPVMEASCWAHSRRKVFELADIEAAAREKAQGEKPNLVYPLAVDAVKAH